MITRKGLIMGGAVLSAIACVVIAGVGALHGRAASAPSAVEWKAVSEQKAAAAMKMASGNSAPLNVEIVNPAPGSVSVDAEQKQQFTQMANTIMQVVHQQAGEGITWSGRPLEQCLHTDPQCVESFLRGPTIIVTAPTHEARRNFSVALTKALLNSGASGLTIMVRPEEKVAVDPQCTATDLKYNTPRCVVNTRVSPWARDGEMRIQFSDVTGVQLDGLSGDQIDALYNWQQP